MRPYPVEVPARTAADVAAGERLPRTVHIGNRGRIDDGGHSAGPGELVQLPEQSEARDVSGTGDPGGQCCSVDYGSQRTHHRNRMTAPHPSFKVTKVNNADAEGFRQGQR